jgi:contact-dependent growth inhibition (CDI) system CdiI-like immunity protein
MIEKNAKRPTLALLDRERGIAEPVPPAGDEHPLAAWYRSVREVPLDDLTVEDISKAIRQNVHLEHVVPLALRFLKSEPLAGEMYEGELLVSFKAVPSQYWSQHEGERLFLKSVVEAALRMEETTQDVRRDAQELLSKTAEHH